MYTDIIKEGFTSGVMLWPAHQLRTEMISLKIANEFPLVSVLGKVSPWRVFVPAVLYDDIEH